MNEQIHKGRHDIFCLPNQEGHKFYDFYQNLQNVRSDVAHFQVRVTFLAKIHPLLLPGLGC